MTVTSNDGLTQVTVTDVNDKTYTYDFKLTASADMDVYLNSTLLTSSQVTISGLNNNNGGTMEITDTNVTLTLNDVITMERNNEIARTQSYQIGGEFKAESVNSEFDDIYLILQDLDRRLLLSASFSSTETASYSSKLPSPEANKFLGWNAAGNAFVNYSFADITLEYDTVISSAQVGDFLRYDGTNWVNVDADQLKTDLSIVKRGTKTTDPTGNDDETQGYAAFSEIINTTTMEKWVCLDASTGAADWQTGTLDSGDLGGAAVKDVSTDTTFATDTDQLRDAAAIDTFVKGETEAAGRVLQTVVATTTTKGSTTTVIPFDNTVPQSTEGEEFLTLAITPKKANSKLLITVSISVADASGNYFIVAMFKDSDAAAIASAMDGNFGSTYMGQVCSTFVVDATNTTARTYKFRYGPRAGNTAYFLRGQSSDQNNAFGSTPQAVVTIQEIAQ